MASSEGWQNLNALLRQRKLESDAEPRAATAIAGGTILLCGDENLNQTRQADAATNAAGETIFRCGNGN